MVDRRRDVEAAHGWYALMASAWTSFTDRLWSFASRTQSRTRHGVDDAAVAPRHFESHGADRRLDVDDLAPQALALDLVVPQTDRGRLAEDDVGQRGAALRRRDDGQQRARAILLHLHRNVEHFQRARGVQPVHRDAEQLRIHVVDLALEDGDALRVRVALAFRAADDDAQDVGRGWRVATAGAVADVLDRHARDRTERRRVRRDNQRARRRDEFLLHRAAIDRRIAQQLHRGRRGHREVSVDGIHHAAADVERGRDDPLGAEPFHAEHRADDVDDRVERAHFVEMHFLHRHLMNLSLRLGEALKHLLGAIARGRRQRGPVDQFEDSRQVPVSVRSLVRGARCVVRGAVFVDDELRGRHAGAQYLLRADVVTGHGKAAERALQLVERQAGVDERAERHVARDAGEAIKVQDAHYSRPISLKLQ